MTTDHKLQSNDQLTKLVKNNGINSWNALTEFIKNLPYGRTTNRSDFGFVISQNKGTCSSKHALLKRVSDLNNIPSVILVLGIFKMNQQNTPSIGTVLSDNAIDYIPEAHCYLKINGKRIDLTSKHSDFKSVKNDIIQEIEIEPEQVVGFKVEYHKSFLKKWLKDVNSGFNFEQIWRIREKCINNRSEKKSS